MSVFVARPYLYRGDRRLITMNETIMKQREAAPSREPAPRAPYQSRKCGTLAAYRRHLRMGLSREEIDGPCLEAHAADVVRQREAYAAARAAKESEVVAKGRRDALEAALGRPGDGKRPPR